MSRPIKRQSRIVASHLANNLSTPTIMDHKKAQPSRKGKRAWRKNIDVADISAGLQAKRDAEVLHGDDGGFVIDTSADAPAAGTFRLKTTEILSNKSKVPALVGKPLRKSVSKAHAKKLMALAGRLQTETVLKARTDRDGLVRGKNVDVWADEKPLALPVVMQEKSFVAYTKPKNIPKTLGHKPIALYTKHKETLVDAGKSYNPSLDLWRALIDKEFDIENDNEKKRQAMEEHQNRIQHLIDTLDDNEVDSSDAEEEEEEEKEEPEEDKYRLSLNKRTELKIKTQTERNRLARHAQRKELEEKLRLLKVQLKDLARLETIEKEVDAKLAQPKKTVEKKYTRHGRNEVIFKPLEVKLSDELTSSLKNLKPEGNLFYDQMHKLQSTGKVEARVPITKTRRYAQKYTEKWSYKDFK